MESPYLNMLAAFGISSAHPGGLPITKHLLDYVKLKRKCSFVDIGCGTGQTLQILHDLGHTVTGIDSHPQMVKQAKERMKDKKDVTLLNIDVEDLPSLHQFFHVALCESVLAFTNISKSLPAIYKVLDDGGYLMAIEMTISEPLSSQDKTELERFYGFAQFLTDDEWISAFQKEQFHVLDVIHPDDWIIHDQPMVELNMNNTIDDIYFQYLATHEQLVMKYKDCLSYTIFICKK
ncbi:class I SAM-dependent methyltransferase [Bacillus kexueae]|uniref:class I SAM-dependent methyltransferase n=1 Tax=Aeribacillus kexueae TaxID=2078952 RepID=UPI001FAF3413|nr:class I SAM-dependent methyltransferase [Bacillus kexueae]